MLAHLVQSYYHHFVSSSSLDYCKLYRVGKICLSLLGILLKQWYPFKLFLCGTLCGCSNFQLVCSALFYTNFMLLLVYMFNRNNEIMTTFIHFFFYLIFIPRLHFRKKTIMYKIMSDTRSATNVNILPQYVDDFAL